MQWCLLLCYPVLAHAAVLRQSPLLGCAALLVLLLAAVWPGLRTGRRTAWLVLAAGGAGLALLHRHDAARIALYLPPIVVQAAMLWVFAASLVAPRVPFVTRIATALRGPLPPELLRYTRAVTVVWALTLGGILLGSLALAAWGSAPAWSLFSNVLAYEIVVAVFVVEYAYRRWRFRALEHPRLLDYLRQVVRHRPHPLA